MSQLIILLILLCAPRSVSAQLHSMDFNQLVDKTHTERTHLLTDYYEKYSFDADSSTLFQNVAIVRELAKQHDDDQLMLEADLMEAHYHLYRLEKGWDHFLQKMLELYSKAQHVPDSDWFTSRIESMIGNVAYDWKEYEAAFVHFTKAVEILKDRSAEEYPIKNICSYFLANLHFQFKEYDATASILNDILSNPSSHDRYYYTISAMNTLGLLFREKGNLDSSNYWFHRVLDTAVANNDSLYGWLTQGNLGENHYLQGDFEKAEPLLMQDLKLAESEFGYGPGHHSNCLYILGDIALEHGDIRKAESLIMKALKMAHRSEQARRLQPVYPVVAKLYKMKGMPELVFAYMDSAIQVNQRLHTEFDGLISARAKQRLELERIATESAKREGERKLQLLLRNVFIGLMVMVLVALVLMFNRHRKALQQRQLVILQEKKMAEDALQSASKRLNEIVSNMQSKNLELESTKKELETLKGEVPERMKEQQRRLEAAVILTDQDWRDFMELFEVVHPGFVDRLKIRYPELTLSQLRFFVLSRMERTNKEMASMLGVSTDAIRQMRSRLRRQLSLKGDETITALALSI